MKVPAPIALVIFFPTSLCGVLVFGSVSRRLLSSSRPPPTHNLLTHNLSTHNLLSHNLSSHNLSTHNLLSCPHATCSHTTCPHTHRASLCVASMAHTQLVHTQLVTYNLSTHNLSTEGVALGDRRGSWRHPPSFHVADVALGHIHICFTWQAWHLRHWAGSGGAPGSQLTPWTPRLSALCVAGVALSKNIERHFAWKAWHWSHPHPFHMAGVALTALGELWWRSGFLADAVDAAALCMAGVALGHIHIRFALGDIHLRFTWQAWHLVTSTFVSRGRRGTYGTGRALVAHRVLS